MSIYLLYLFLEMGIIDRVESKDGAGFTIRDSPGKDGANGLYILLLFPLWRGTFSIKFHLLGW
jgi:hypothetical protein